ncbi:flap endonuclease-1 [Nitzschia inconspicua]|uniref:Flap endonuclease-1 n=1 Tax=Nitzschia inconspicua TaxID=303405 RepID=A0A9K3PZP5_9STRA|nr:flap endonuclease-1 [Nitzschia inconspicua]
MTVSSLWKALDRAGCGRCVGAKELQDHHGLLQKTNPWNFRQMQQQRMSHRPTLAVDLSIWICEALTSAAMQQHHVADPPLQLVYSRTLRLLNLGIKLVVVIEGKRRIRRSDDCDNDKFLKRRSGARFWSACERCETMLRNLGVLVVRAKAEGEALCALLNQRGIVDGVISNDGDCFLFGAKVLYTKFTVDNLEQSKVMRYDSSDIRACLDDDDADKYDAAAEKDEEGSDIVKLSRDDLIAFAILTGSDLAGDGLAKVGCRKAIRFIRKCRIDNPLKTDESPAMAELISWGKLAGQSRCPSDCDDDTEDNETSHNCSCCGHPGDKRSHKKHGCNICGTEPGEPCFQLSPGGKFRKLLRSKALAMKSKFDPASTIQLYHQPNENQVPLSLVGKTSATLEMNPPNLQKLLQSKVIIRGGTLVESRQFLQKTLSAYLARTELFYKANEREKNDFTTKLPKNLNRPVPKCVAKLITRGGKSACEVQWIIKGTMTDEEGNSIDNLEFSTIEEESLVKRSYPELLDKYKEQVQKMDDQGDAEQIKRQAFLNGMFGDVDHCEASQEAGKGVLPSKDTKKIDKARLGFFEELFTAKMHAVSTKGRSDDLRAILADVQIASRKKREKQKLDKEDVAKKTPARNVAQSDITGTQGKEENDSCGDDIAKILYADLQQNRPKRDDDSTIASSTIIGERQNVLEGVKTTATSYSDNVLTPGHIHFLKSHQVQHTKCHTKTCFVSFKDELDVEHLDNLHQEAGSLVTKCTNSLSSEGLQSMRGIPFANETIRQQRPTTVVEMEEGLTVDDFRETYITTPPFVLKCWDSVPCDTSEIKDFGKFPVESNSSFDSMSVTWHQRTFSQSPLLKKKKGELRRKESLVTSLEWRHRSFDVFDQGHVPTGEDPKPFVYHTNEFSEEVYNEDVKQLDHVQLKSEYDTLRDRVFTDSYCNHSKAISRNNTRSLRYGLSMLSSLDQCGGFIPHRGLDDIPSRREQWEDTTHAWEERCSVTQRSDTEFLRASDNRNRKRSRYRSNTPHQQSAIHHHIEYRDDDPFGGTGGETQLLDDAVIAVDPFLDGRFLDYGDYPSQRTISTREIIPPRARSDQLHDKELERRIEKKLSLAKSGAAVNRLFVEGSRFEISADAIKETGSNLCNCFRIDQSEFGFVRKRKWTCSISGSD